MAELSERRTGTDSVQGSYTRDTMRRKGTWFSLLQCIRYRTRRKPFMKQQLSQLRVAACNEIGRKTGMRQRLAVLAVRGGAACCPRLGDDGDACGQSYFWLATGTGIKRRHTQLDLFSLCSALLSLRRMRASANPLTRAICSTKHEAENR